MSKIKDQVIDEQNAEQPDFVKELMEKGSVTLTAESRDSLYEKAATMVGLIPQGTKWTRSIVDHDVECTVFTQTYSLIKNE